MHTQGVLPGLSEAHQLVDAFPGGISEGDGGAGVGCRSQLTTLLDQAKQQIGHSGCRLMGRRVIVLFTALSIEDEVVMVVGDYLAGDPDPMRITTVI